jgi:Fe-S cluster assembly protein SufD
MKKIVIKDNSIRYFINEINPDVIDISYLIEDNCNLVIVQNLTGFKDINIDFEIYGKGSNVIFYGYFVGNGDDKLSVVTRQHHISGGSASRLYVRSVLNGRSSVSYNGTIRVERDSSGTDAIQQNDNLLLSDTAEAICNPALEILSDDLRCTHSASILHVRPEEIWFLQNRGIDRKRAEGMIAAGFLADIISDIPATKKTAEIIPQIQSLFLE